MTKKNETPKAASTANIQLFKVVGKTDDGITGTIFNKKYKSSAEGAKDVSNLVRDGALNRGDEVMFVQVRSKIKKLEAETIIKTSLV